MKKWMMLDDRGKMGIQIDLYKRFKYPRRSGKCDVTEYPDSGGSLECDMMK